MLEEVREAALAGLDLIARTGADHDVERDDVRIIGGNGDQAEAVGQVLLNIRIGEDFSCAE